MILVAGATGLLGNEICHLLSKDGRNVKALVRSTADPDKIQLLKNYGCNLEYGDLKDSSTLKNACENVTTVISTASSTLSRQEGDSIQTVDLEGQIKLIDEARGCGVEHFIFISFRNDPEIHYPLSSVKRDVEKHLLESGMNYTILQASWFMEVWLSAALGFDYGKGNANIYGRGTNKISWISYKDVAKFAAAFVDNTAAVNRIVEVGGPEALTPLEVVKIFEEAAGKSFAVTNVPEESLMQQMDSSADPLQQSFAGLMLQYAHGDEINMSKTLQDFSIQLTSVKEFARSVVSTVSTTV